MQPGAATILCIDDDLTGLKIRKLLLERSGYRVLTAASGREGIDIFQRNAVDAVVLDYYMPGMSGGDVAIELKRLKPATPIIMLSAYVALPDEVMEYVDIFIQKGQPPEAFLEKLGHLLGTSAAR
jgi:CheY-like chemotaxis protein